MATPTRDAIDTFMRITGASEFIAVRKLEEYGGNLNEAVNAHFMEGDRLIPRPNFSAASQFNSAEVNNNQNHVGAPGLLPQNRVRSPGLLPLLSAARRFRPSLLLDPNYRRELRDLYNGFGSASFNNHGPYLSHPGEMSDVPVGIGGAYEQTHHPGLISTSADRTRDSFSHSQGMYGVDDYQTNNNNQSNTSHLLDIENEMIQAAIEASKQESRDHYVSSDSHHPQVRSHQEDDDLAHAISLSLKMEEQEKAKHKHLVRDKNEELQVHNLLAMGKKTSSSRWEPGTSMSGDGAQNGARPNVHHASNQNATGRLQGNEDVLISEEWGGISSEELNEAVLLENALFGETSGQSSHDFSSLPHLQHGSERNECPQMQGLPSSPTPTSRSQSLTTDQLLREQQDADYLASLLADREKELNALREAESRRSEEEELRKKILESKEWEKVCSMKQASFPKEPPIDDENAITIVIRMPDGTRQGRRFLRTDKLQLLFDFIDIGGAVKPGTYRVVKSYPRRAYSVDDSSLTLSEVGLNNKQEALFVELI